MKIFRIIFFATMFPACMFGQVNLVRNGSFEEISRCPGYKYSEGSVEILKYWNEYSIHAMGFLNPQIYAFNRCAEKRANPLIVGKEFPYMGQYKGVPKNVFGYAEPYCGNGYALISVICSGSLMEDKRVRGAYLQSRLVNQLDSGRTYYLEFYVKATDNSSFVTDAIGVTFTEKPLAVVDFTCVDELKPYLKYEGDELDFKKNKGWTKISGTFISRGKEEFISIGNFLKYEEIYVKRFRVKRLADYKTKNLDDFNFLIDNIILYQVDNYGLPASY